MLTFVHLGRVLMTGGMALTILAAPFACAPAESTPSPDRRRPAKSQVPDPAPDAPGRPTAPLGAASDPCADRLHAICGPMLLYFAIHRRLPDDIEELRAVAGPDPEVEFTCPVSGKPYVYNPQGVPRGQGRPGLLVLYDAEPTHSGLRWGVAAEPPRNTAQPLVTQVVAEPELMFHDVPPSPLDAPAQPDAPAVQQ
jgi:hypothetical protein